MTRVLCAFALLTGALGVTCADDKDPVKEKLLAAKETYRAELRQYQKAVGEWFDKREESARKDGNKKVVDQIKAERGVFDESGELPKTVPAALRQKPAVAKKSLEAAYAQAVKEYTMAKKDAEAASVEEAWKAFPKEDADKTFPKDNVGEPSVPTVYAGRSGAMKAKLIE